MPLTQMDGAVDVALTWRVPVARRQVWACLTDSRLLGQWLGAVVEGRIAPGSSVLVAHGEGYLCSSRVVEHVEAERLAMTWDFADEPVSMVTVDLHEDKDGTVLRLHHGALGPLADSYRLGWCTHLTYLEGAALGTPLPRSMFWSLHGTISRLSQDPDL